MPGDLCIRIGNQTAFSAPSLMAPFHFALENGFEAFEWFPDKNGFAGWDETDLDAGTRHWIRHTSESAGLRTSVHARWQANPLRPDAWGIFLRDIQLAQDIGAKLLNIHLYPEEGIEAYFRAIVPLAERVREAGMQLAIENTPVTTPQHFNELFQRLQTAAGVQSGQVGMCFDLGHANLCAPTYNDYLKYFDQLSTDVAIIHLHLHENWGDRDSHLALFSGPSGLDDSGIRKFLGRLRDRNFSGSGILEQWPQPTWLLQQARDRFRQLRDECANSARNPAPPVVEKPGEERPITVQPSETASSSAADFIHVLVEGNQGARSWREKLDFVCRLFVERGRDLSPQELVDIAIYLRFLGAGEIPCVEDGRHFRPSHHAKISIQIQEQLARLATPENVFIIRKIQPWLPSSEESYTRAEPLTRIRDIAHRNDIPSDLKREIKTTLQNKLHRCAGPEDLATSASLLKRITEPGSHYSEDFVEQFKIFHRELTEFFNASSLDSRLHAIAENAPAEFRQPIDRFSQLKSRLSGAIDEAGERNRSSDIGQKTGKGNAGSGDLPALVELLQVLVELRRHLGAATEKRPGALTQDLLLADIGLEDFTFVLLSELGNAFEQREKRLEWDSLLEVLSLAFESLIRSGIAPEECHAIRSEFDCWRREFDSNDRDQLLRLKATADRARRLAENHADRVLNLFLERAEKLGRALGIAEYSVRIFCEGEIRGHVVFQLSRLLSVLLKQLRHEAKLPSWEVLVAGCTRGQLRLVNSLDELHAESAEPIIALLRRAEGDEEIPQAVTGVILAHPLPHLSHLGVRARQGKVVFITCDEPAKFQELEKASGKALVLEATAAAVAMKPDSTPPAGRSKPAAAPPIVLPAVALNVSRALIDLNEATLENAGGKAFGLRRLAELSQKQSSGFATSPALVIPFGVMESCLAADGSRQAEYRRWLDEFGKGSDTEEVGARIRDVINRLKVPPAVVSGIIGKFPRDSRLMIRSSANSEDLRNFAAAGLYESVANIKPSEVANAVREVWASLWTRRAALSRRQAGISPEQAHMAVIVQRMIAPDLSFIIHTTNPTSRDPDEACIELAAGLGETLASAVARGNPWRMVCRKKSGETSMLAFGNFSEALCPEPSGGLRRQTLDYSRIPLSQSRPVRDELGRRLATIAQIVEKEFDSPQDIEGAVAGEKIYLVQSRAQQGLAS